MDLIADFIPVYSCMLCAGNRDLIAVNAPVGTAGVGEENGDYKGTVALRPPVGFAGQPGCWFLVSGHWQLVPIELRVASYGLRVASTSALQGSGCVVSCTELHTLIVYFLDS